METVKVLLEDIYEVFEQSYLPVKDAEMTSEVMEKFNWYYMNVFITNKINNKTYIVDGQQRLSTLTLLLLKERMNISSGNESYREKLKTYSNGTIWAKTLCNTWYHTNPDFTDFNKWLKATTNKEFIPYDSFTIQSMKERSQLLYELVKIIWEVDSKGASE